MKTLKPKFLILMLLFASATAFAQTKKLDKTFNTSKDVKVEIDSKHTKLIIEQWEKDQVQVEASLDKSDLSPEEVKKQLENWKLDVAQTNGVIHINSGGGMTWDKEIDFAGMEEMMGSLAQLIEPIMTEMVAPMVKNLSENPPLPPDFAAKIGNLEFDFEAYRKDGEKYMQKWEKQVEKNFGKDFEKSMEKWAEQFEKNAEIWEKDLSAKMEVNEKDFEKKMEAWGASFEAKMEIEMGKKDGSGGNFEGAVPAGSSRTIKVKVPAGARLNMDVRHGEVILGQRVKNLKADLSHSKFSANILEGEGTEISASYTPVKVSQWNYGVLNASYIENVDIVKARSIKLNSNSSNVNIGEITETGFLSGSFGDLKIARLDPGFKILDITLKNSDLVLDIPDAPLKFDYNGSQSEIEYPKTSTVKSSKSYDNEILNGFYKSGDASGRVSINATFSEIVIK